MGRGQRLLQAGGDMLAVLTRALVKNVFSESEDEDPYEAADKARF